MLHQWAMNLQDLKLDVKKPRVARGSRETHGSDVVNHRWLTLSLGQWIHTADHPVPIVSLYKEKHILRLNNAESLGERLVKTLSCPLTVRSPCYYTRHKKSKDFGWTLFRENVESWILGNRVLHSASFKVSSVCQLIQETNRPENFLLWFKYKTINILAILRCMHRHNANRKARTNKICGQKVTMEIVVRGPVGCSAWLYSMSYTFARGIMRMGHIIGNQSFYYNYRAKFMAARDDPKNPVKHYVYFEYVPAKKVKSIIDYYAEHNNCMKKIRQEQQKDCPPGWRVNYSLSLKCPHVWWTGVRLQRGVISKDYKMYLFHQVMNMLETGDSAVQDFEPNRIKLSLLFYYLYKMKEVTRQKMKIAEGVRMCPQQKLPVFVQELIQHCHRVQFIPESDVINQITIMIYYHQKKKKSHKFVFAGLNPHRNEHKKFAKVYSLSAYSPGWNDHTYISFQLRENYTNGDLRIPIPDCVGIELKPGSWCMCDGTSHSISPNELKIPVGQWRIVFLFRVLRQLIEQQARAEEEESEEEEEEEASEEEERKTNKKRKEKGKHSKHSTQEMDEDEPSYEGLNLYWNDYCSHKRIGKTGRKQRA